MTDPTGRSFLSYRRTRRHEAELVIQSQHDLGIQTWHDIKNLDETHTELEIRKILASSQIANAIFWISPEVKDSIIIRDVEIPMAIKRAEAEDGFFCIPVAVGGLDYQGAADVLNKKAITHSIDQWNIRKLKYDPITQKDAKFIAKRVLHRRLQAIHKIFPKDEPLRLKVFTRTKSSIEPRTALTIDWTNHFKGRNTLSETWSQLLLPALKEIANAILEHAPNRKIEISGLCSIPAATALGYAFMAPRGQHITWIQHTTGQENQYWNLDCERSDSGFKYKTIPNNASGKDLAVLVSVSAEVDQAFNTSKTSLPSFRAITKIFKPGKNSHNIQTPCKALDIAFRIIEAIRNARSEYVGLNCVHLFVAAPVGLSFMIGQLLNTLGPIKTYEHIQNDVVGHYEPACLLMPSN